MNINASDFKEEVIELAATYKFLLGCGNLKNPAILAGHNYCIAYQLYQKLTKKQINGVPTIERVKRTLSELEKGAILQDDNFLDLDFIDSLPKDYLGIQNADQRWQYKIISNHGN